MKERKAELNFRNHAVKSFFLFIYLFIYFYLFIYLVYASPFRVIIIQVYR